MVCFVVLVNVHAFNTNVKSVAVQISNTKLFAHHPQKKIIKKIMHRRPIKHRLSDINRKNVNLNKCITKIENAPAEYTLLSADGKKLS